MGKGKVRLQAEELGYTNFRLTTLYARPRQIKMRQRFLMRYIPDIVPAIRDYIIWNDPSTIEVMDGTKNLKFYYVAEKIKLYVEIFDKTAFWTVMNPAKHATQINMYCNNEEIVRGIANAVNQVFEDGILAHMDWKWIEKKWKVKREDCISVWKRLL
ncbi:MAG: hypothetical protein HWN65_17835 [Candidatus Helarchaeota archaeon]|nr:hypothetical protein [Candidatus Helarchaeota archaeon]